LSAQLTVKICLARNAAERFVDDRRAGAMELLLSTPLTPGEIIAGQWAALRLYFGGPVVFLCVAELLLFLAGSRSATRSNSMAFWGWLCAANGVAALMDLRALAWVAMAKSLVAKNASQASAAAVARIMVLPWLVYIGILPIFFLLAGSRPGKIWEYMPLALWLAVSLVVDAVFSEMAKRTLYGQFRALAMENDPRPTGWRRLLEIINPWAARRRWTLRGEMA
jgi:hypothetical protein